MFSNSNSHAISNAQDTYITAPVTGQALTFNAAIGKWQNVTPLTVPDATTSSKGVVQLAGDLGGSATAPTVPGLASKADTTTVTNGLATKENTITAGTTTQYYRGDKTFQTLDKTAVGLSNVDNTSDASKPVSTAVQTALNAKADAATVGAKVVVYNTYADAPALPANTVVVSITGT